MAFYEEMADTASDLIEEFGQAGALRRTVNSGTAYNPTLTPTDHACTLVVSEYKNFEIDGSRVLATDKKVLLSTAALAIEPVLSDKLLIGGVAHSIVRVMPVSPGGTVVLWELQVRR